MSEIIYKRPESLIPGKSTTFCPGCGHGIVTNIYTTLLDEMGLRDNAITVSSVGCAGLNPMFVNTDIVMPMHGRAPAVATGVKRCRPDKFVYTTQGDGDLASIGTAEIVQAAHRGEKITVLFINNAVYGMTGGQMAPTTLVGQKTTTSQDGRSEEWSGKPIRICELLSTLEGCKFAERVSVDSPAHVAQAKKAVQRAFECQLKGLGFSIVEFISTCPTNWGLSPLDSMKWLRENMLAYYPLGRFKDYED